LRPAVRFHRPLSRNKESGLTGKPLLMRKSIGGFAEINVDLLEFINTSTQLFGRYPFANREEHFFCIGAER
jgi:hypothetical protein